MSGRIFKSAGVAGAALLAACWGGACAPKAIEPVRFDTAGLRAAADYTHLAYVLKHSVTGGGVLNRRKLADCTGRLDAQLALLAVTGPTASPELFGGKDESLAYWYNARAAWAIKLASLLAKDQQAGPDLLEDKPFILDGRTMTLRDIDAILASDADWRVLAAGPDVRFSRAPLPAQPFRPADVRGQLPARLNNLLADPMRFVIDVERREIRVPPVLWQFRGRIMEEYRKAGGGEGATCITALLPLARGRATGRLQDAIGYAAVAGPAYGEIAAE